jgi:hypothetical protein
MVATCDDSYKTKVHVHDELILTECLGDSGICDNVCESSSPCQNFGTCVDNWPGFSCQCIEGCSGNYCENTPPCNYISAFACLDILQYATVYFRGHTDEICEIIDDRLLCLQVNLMSCSANDYAFLEIIFIFMESIQISCQTNTPPTCEQIQIYESLSEVVNIFYPYPGTPSAPDTSVLCPALQFCYDVALNISVVCGTTPIFSLEFSYKISGALDFFCPQPYCSLTAADVCLDALFELISSDSLNGTNSSCEEVWEYQACVQLACSECTGDKLATCTLALESLLTLSEANCPSPCGSKPCRNGGSCQQNSASTYQCICPEGWNGRYCQTPVTCDWVAVEACLEPCASLITVGLLNACNTPPDNCGPLLAAPACIKNVTRTCPPSQQKRAAALIKAISDVTYVCKSGRPQASGCSAISAVCGVTTMESVYLAFVEQAFGALTASCIVDYETLCQTWNLTISDLNQYSLDCASSYKANVNISIAWLLELTSGICVTWTDSSSSSSSGGRVARAASSQTLTGVCLPDYLDTAWDCIDNETEATNARPSLPPADRDIYCLYVENILIDLENDVLGCTAAVSGPVNDQCDAKRKQLSDTCEFPCQSKPCQHGGTCQPTGYNSYICHCPDIWNGTNCTQVSQFPTNGDSPVPSNPGNNNVLLEVTLPLPLFIFCYNFNSIYISENGYISLDGTAVTSFNEFGGTKQTLIAPLFAMQDASCTGSSVSYQVYVPSNTMDQATGVFERADADVAKNSGLIDFQSQMIITVTWTNMMPFPCSVYLETEPNLQGCTYQATIITDLNYTFVSYIYTNVQVVYQLPNVYMGYAGADGRTFSSYLSTTSSMNNFQNAPSSTTGQPGWWWYSLTTNPGESCAPPPTVSTPPQKCLNWFRSTPRVTSQNVDSCPCNDNQASLDARCHLVTVNWFQICYSVNNVAAVASQGNTLEVVQTCCYDPWSNGALFTSPPFAGFPVLENPASGSLNDSDAYNACCVQSSQYCNLFMLARPSSTCNTYSAPITSMIWGDPHLITTDNFYYDFNAIGEFWMIQTTDGSFSLQCRTAQMQTSAGAGVNASSFVAFAAQQNGYSKVEVDLNPTGDGILFYLNGVQQTLTSAAQKYPAEFYISASSTSFNATFPAGWSMTVGLGVRMLTIIQTVPGVAWGKTLGLLGVYNGDPTDDLMTPSGTVLPPDSTAQTIYYGFGLKWQITSNSSLFTYPTGKSSASYVNAAFTPAFSPPCSSAADNKTGAQTCAGASTPSALQNCFFDYCVTKDTAVAEDTLTTQENYLTSQAVLRNNGPKLTISGSTPDANGVYMVTATVGSQVTFVLTAVSQMVVQINVEMVGNVSKQAVASLTQLNSSASTVNYAFAWTPVNLNPVDVSFVAVDSNGAVSNKLSVIVVICDGCSGKGACVFSSWTPIYNGTVYRQAACTCTTGYTGSNCALAFDGCAAMPCGANNTGACTDLTPLQQQSTGVAYSCTSCPPGYNTDQCVDINECVMMPVNSPCQVCINTIGSYLCACHSGYQLAPGGLACVDIDECADMISGCPQQCTNTPGSFSCSCYAGYTGINCNATTACGANQCSYKCSMVGGQQTCTCMSGFALSSNGVSCQDINECTNPDLNKCSVPSSCTNMIGGYTCSCPAGQTVGVDMRTCQPCSDTTWGPNCANQCNCGQYVRACDKMQGCTICQSGWQGANCEQDVNECTAGTARCQTTATCVNVPGTYLCVCSDGSGDLDCYASGGTPCSQCMNGGLCVTSANQQTTCSCPSGYTGQSCEIQSTPIGGGAGPNIKIIVPVVVIGGCLIIAAAILIYYMVCVRPKRNLSRKYEQAPSDLTADGSQTRFSQSSTRINQYWPRSPQRYTPQTYNPQNEDNI